jgi:gas vesicle protein
MIIFGIDIRRRVCKKYEEWLSMVELGCQFKNILEDETSEETRKLLEDIKSKIDQVIDIKKEEMNTSIHDFEREFVKEVIENKGFYEN